MTFTPQLVLVVYYIIKHVSLDMENMLRKWIYKGDHNSCSNIPTDTHLQRNLKCMCRRISAATLLPYTLSLGVGVQDTLEKEGREGIHKAMYSLLSWVLEQSRSTIQAFWSNMMKEYNLESYPKLQILLTNLHSSMWHHVFAVCFVNFEWTQSISWLAAALWSCYTQ